MKIGRQIAEKTLSHCNKYGGCLPNPKGKDLSVWAKDVKPQK